MSIRDRLGGVINNNEEQQNNSEEVIDSILIDESSPTTQRLNGEGSMFLRNKYLGMYYHINVQREDSGVWKAYITYGKPGKKCKTPIIMRFNTRSKCLAFVNNKVRKKTSEGFELPTE